MSPPRLPKEMRRPQPTLRSMWLRLDTKKRQRVSLALAQELSMLHEDGTAVGRLSPDTVTFSMTGYPHISQIGAAKLDSPFTAPELSDPRLGDTRPHGTSMADVHSLGMLIYFIYTGREPPPQLTTRHFARLSPTAAMLVSRCVAKRPKDRPTAAAVAETLDDAGPAALESTGLSHPIDLIRKKPAQVWSMASVVALTGTAMMLVLTGTAATALGAVGVAAMLLGASITVGASF